MEVLFDVLERCLVGTIRKFVDAPSGRERRCGLSNEASGRSGIDEDTASHAHIGELRDSVPIQSVRKSALHGRGDAVLDMRPGNKRPWVPPHNGTLVQGKDSE